MCACWLLHPCNLLTARTCMSLLLLTASLLMHLLLVLLLLHGRPWRRHHRLRRQWLVPGHLQPRPQTNVPRHPVPPQIWRADAASPPERRIRARGHKCTGRRQALSSALVWLLLLLWFPERHLEPRNHPPALLLPAAPRAALVPMGDGNAGCIGFACQVGSGKRLAVLHQGEPPHALGLRRVGP